MTPILQHLTRAAAITAGAYVIAQHYYSLGKAKGLLQGHATGTADGHTVGYAEGYTGGYQAGYDQAITNTRKDTQIAHLRGQLMERFNRLRAVETGRDEAC